MSLINFKILKFGFCYFKIALISFSIFFCALLGYLINMNTEAKNDVYLLHYLKVIYPSMSNSK